MHEATQRKPNSLIEKNDYNRNHCYPIVDEMLHFIVASPTLVWSVFVIFYCRGLELASHCSSLVRNTILGFWMKSISYAIATTVLQ